MGMTPQELTRRSTERREKRARGLSMRIVGLTFAERDLLRARVFYSGAGDDHISSWGMHLALAVMELARLRRRKKVSVRITPEGFEVSAKRKR